jgi:16S rRNA (uracil1498-N3)-methyltransferase
MVPHARIIQAELCGMLSEDNRHRLERVLRLREGDRFVITDGLGHEAEATLERSGNYRAFAWQSPGREPEIAVTVFAAVSKGERLEWLIEKAVEMGVRKIVPIMAERCVVKNPGMGKIERWRKVAATAMIQCGGCYLPEVAEPVPVTRLAAPDSSVAAILLHEETLSKSLHGLTAVNRDKKNIWLASGPEGGFSDAEVGYLLDSGWQPVWLGKRLFKTDTAPVVALANILSGSWGA